MLLETFEHEVDTSRVRRTLEYGWSCDVLALQIRSPAQRNFATTLPSPEYDIAAQVFKGSYWSRQRAVLTGF